MNIKELIEKLKKFPEECEVFFDVTSQQAKSENSIACRVGHVVKGYSYGKDRLLYVVLMEDHALKGLSDTFFVEMYKKNQIHEIFDES